MNKFSKILVLCLVICAVVGVFAACDSTKYGPIGSTEFAGSEVVNNGGLVVKQGGYLYYVNGMDSTSNITKPSDNYFGKASVKGSIMKSEIKEDGTLGKTDVVVPKMFYTSASNGGFYIYGEWIYYMSPSTKTDNQSNVLTSQLVAARTKIDGTKTQEIANLSSSSTQYVFTENEFIYFADHKLNKVCYDNSKVNKKVVEISDKIDAALFTQKSTAVFFIKPTEDSARRNNNMYVYVGGEVKSITTDATYENSANDLRQQFTYALVSYDPNENVLFYTKAINANDASKATQTYGYKFTDGYTLDPAKEKRFAVSGLTSFVNLGFDKGIMDTSAATLTLYKPLAEDAYVNDTEKYATLSATGAKIVQINGDTMYYVLSNALYRINYTDKKALADKISEEAINTSWLSISVIDGRMYYIDNTYNYMYSLKLDDYVSLPNDLQYAKGAIVSGTRKAVLSKDKDGNIEIKYVADDASEEGVTYYQIPKFMTEADAKTYANALYEEDNK